MKNWFFNVDRYIHRLEDVFLKDEKENIDSHKKRIMAVELLACIQPLIFFQYDSTHVLSIQNVLYCYALPGSAIWQRIAVSINL